MFQPVTADPCVSTPRDDLGNPMAAGVDSMNRLPTTGVEPCAGTVPSTGHLPALETLRGLAIVLVVLFHFYGILGGVPSPDTPLPVRWIAAGNTGVTLFFVLSGFLLARPFLAGIRAGRRLDMGRFYRARVLRIMPAYLVIVAVAWVVTRDPALWKALIFIPLGMEAFPFALPWWSLCTEVQFYAVLPWLMLLPKSRAGRWLLAAGLLAWLGTYAWCAVGLEWPPATRLLRNSLFGRGTGFLAGGLLAWFFLTPSFSRFRQSRAAVWVVFASSAGALLALLAWYGGRSQASALEILPLFHDLEAILWTGVMASCLGGVDRSVPHVLRVAFDRTAIISYSLYLVHVPVQFYLIYPATQIAEASARRWWLGIAVTASVIASWLIAWLGERFIERPFLRRKTA